METAMNALDLIAAAQARRAAAGLVSVDGIACPNAAWLAYYNARAALPRDAEGRIRTTTELRALKAAAVASTTA
ncbi:hypothetical protein G5V65_11215 [Rhodobacter sp. HX-7-19]|uniref:Uncharacterized protein n=1 Tax=Paragemmobacter kunshanensis TaxID=2583234 RepID=A0A6M1TXG0_9RHOB|nr:hypothetical protein [Rhodobacter kunshanensis]NGQ91466.1 hypothetical protein [Rhodobacter kunshanensis]